MPTIQQLVEEAKKRDEKAPIPSIIGKIIDSALQAKKIMEGATPIPIARPPPPMPPGGPPPPSLTLGPTPPAGAGILAEAWAAVQRAGARAGVPPERLEPAGRGVEMGARALAPAEMLAQLSQQAYQARSREEIIAGFAEEETQRFRENVKREPDPQEARYIQEAAQLRYSQETAPVAGLGKTLLTLGGMLGAAMAPSLALKFPIISAFLLEQQAEQAGVIPGEPVGRGIEFLAEPGKQNLMELGMPEGAASIFSELMLFGAIGRAPTGQRTLPELMAAARQLSKEDAAKAVKAAENIVLRREAGMAKVPGEPTGAVPSELGGRTLRPGERPRRAPGPTAEETFWGAERPYLRSRQDLVDDLAGYITEAKTYAGAKVALRHKQLQQKAAIIGRERATAEGMPGIQRAARTLAGEQRIPEYEAPAHFFTPAEVNELANMIVEAELRPITYAATSNAFIKAFVLGEKLRMSEIARLEKVFGPKLAAALMEQKGLPARTLYQVLDVLNLPRAFIASFDFSYPLRQAVVPTVMHPIEAVKAFKAMFRSISERRALQIAKDLENHPSADLWERVGLDYNVPFVGGARSVREDAYASRLADKFPGIRMSQRVFVTYGNKLRAEMFETYRLNWEAIGRTFESHPEEFRSLARWCNISSGRGEVAWIREFLPSLNAVFFSPRLFISRIQMPLEAFTTTPLARQLVVRDMVGFTMTGITTLAALKVSGLAEVEIDPRSADFGKIKIGKTRIDFWGGFQPIARYTAQLITGHAKYPTRPGLPQVVGIDPRTTVGRFLWSKSAPGPGLIADIVMGRTFIGQDIDLQPSHIKEQVFNRAVPLFVQDLVDATRQAGIKGFLLAMPGVLGVGIQTYERANEKVIAFLEEVEPVLTDSEKAALERGVVPNVIREMPEWQELQGEVEAERRDKPAAQQYQADLDQRNGIIQQASDEYVAGRITGTEYRLTAADARNEFRIKNDVRDFPGGGFLDEYYKATYDRATDELGQLDMEKLDEYIVEWEAGATPEELAAIQEHELAADDPVERQLRADRVYIRDSGYWDLDESLWAYAHDKGVPVNGKRVKPPSDVDSLEDFLAGYAEWKTKELIADGLPQDEAVAMAWGHARNLPLVKKLRSMLSARRADEREDDGRLREALLRWYKPISQEEMERYGQPVGGR